MIANESFHFDYRFDQFLTDACVHDLLPPNQTLTHANQVTQSGLDREHGDPFVTFYRYLVRSTPLLLIGAHCAVLTNA